MVAHPSEGAYVGLVPLCLSLLLIFQGVDLRQSSGRERGQGDVVSFLLHHEERGLSIQSIGILFPSRIELIGQIEVACHLPK